MSRTPKKASKKKETLHFLAASSSTTAVDAARVLLEKGENPQAVDKNGLTPLHYACANDNVAMAQLLLSFGSDPMCTDKMGRTALSVAKGNTLRFLRRYQKRDRHQRLGIFRRFFACHTPNNPTFFITRNSDTWQRAQPTTIADTSLVSLNRGNALTRSYRQAKRKIRATIHQFRERGRANTLRDVVMTSEGLREVETPTREARMVKRGLVARRKSVSVADVRFETIPDRWTIRNEDAMRKARTPEPGELKSTWNPIPVKPSAPPLSPSRSRRSSAQNTTNYWTAEESIDEIEERVQKMVITPKMANTPTTPKLVNTPTTPNTVNDGEMRRVKRMRDAELRVELKKFGISPAGPFDPKIRRLYEKRLLAERQKLIEIGYSPDMDSSQMKYSPQLELVVRAGQIPEDFARRARRTDEAVRGEFIGDGFGYTAFCYLILDPRLLGNDVERVTFATFVNSIFYVGKGTKNRPLAHFIDARNERREKSEKLKKNEKLRIIDELWSLGHGIPRHEIAHGISDEEAYVREASLIEAIGVANLSNQKGGEFHGRARNWDSVTKAEYGVYLLNSALATLKAEGIRLIHEKNLPDTIYPFVNNRRMPKTPK